MYVGYVGEQMKKALSKGTAWALFNGRCHEKKAPAPMIGCDFVLRCNEDIAATNLLAAVLWCQGSA